MMAGMHDRRTFLVGAASLAVGGCARPQSPTMSTADALPTIFLPHGGGPWTIADMGLREMYAPLRAYLASLPSLLPTKPRAILCVSAHWETEVPTVQSAARPPMLYDYGGFPPETYEYQWNAPGAPDMAAMVRDHLGHAGFATAEDNARGFDHGTFVPLMVPFPDADMPTFQVSLLGSLDPEAHLKMGRALAPLRRQGVLIVGSGMGYHNMRNFGAAFRNPDARKRVAHDSTAFDTWLQETVQRPADARLQRLAEWDQAPAARPSHPREEHLLPLMVAAGAAEDAPATIALQTDLLGARVSAVHFG